MKAAASAAEADGVLGSNNQASSIALQQARNAMAVAAAVNNSNRVIPKPKKKGAPLRRGKWTPEEEAYAARLIQEFKAGLLPLTDGTTLRTFLSKLLNCDPMRISKKFVGSNCIGKQVFRRRTADLNRLTPEQIQKSRVELSELERRFLERVAQTNRVKSSGVTATPAAPADLKSEKEFMTNGVPEVPSPPWLQPPLGYRHGQGQAFAQNNLSSNSRAAAAGRALLGASLNLRGPSTSNLAAAAQHGGSAGFLAMAQRGESQNSLLQNALQQQGSASNLLAAAVRSGSTNGLSASMAQIARDASAARLAGQLGGDTSGSLDALILKTGLSRDQLSQLARERGLPSSGSLTNMIQRQNSFDALMSLDFQSLQSIDNLANLIQSHGNTGFRMPESGIKNADFGAFLAAANSANNLANVGASSNDLSDAARRLARAASQGRMESLLRTLSTNNVGDQGDNNSNMNFSNLLSQLGRQNDDNNASVASLLNAAVQGGGNSQSAVSLANLFRQESHTGLSSLRAQDGLAQRNSSVDDFLSLVAAGDIPHQDPNLLNMPLLQQPDSAAKLLAQHQLLQQSFCNNNGSVLANALANRGNVNSSNSQLASLLMAQAARASASKRSLDELTGDLSDQGDSKC